MYKVIVVNLVLLDILISIMLAVVPFLDNEEMSDLKLYINAMKFLYWVTSAGNQQQQKKFIDEFTSGPMFQYITEVTSLYAIVFSLMSRVVSMSRILEEYRLTLKMSRNSGHF